MDEPARLLTLKRVKCFDGFPSFGRMYSDGFECVCIESRNKDAGHSNHRIPAGQYQIKIDPRKSDANQELRIFIPESEYSAIYIGNYERDAFNGICIGMNILHQLMVTNSTITMLKLLAWMKQEQTPVELLILDP